MIRFGGHHYSRMPMITHYHIVIHSSKAGGAAPWLGKALVHTVRRRRRAARRGRNQARKRRSKKVKT